MNSLNWMVAYANSGNPAVTIQKENKFFINFSWYVNFLTFEFAAFGFLAVGSALQSCWMFAFVNECNYEGQYIRETSASMHDETYSKLNLHLWFQTRIRYTLHSLIACFSIEVSFLWRDSRTCLDSYVVSNLIVYQGIHQLMISQSWSGAVFTTTTTNNVNL